MWEVFGVIRTQWNYFLRQWQRRRRWVRCSDELLCAETGVVLQPSVHRASHPTHIHTPSKINFPFRPRFPARLSWEKAFSTARSVLMVQSSASKTRAGEDKDFWSSTTKAASNTVTSVNDAERDRKFAERHFLPSIQYTCLLWADQREWEMLHWSSHCWLVHLQHGVGSRW